MLIRRVPNLVPIPGVTGLGSLCGQAARRTSRSSSCATNSACCADRSTDPRSPTPTGACSGRVAAALPRPLRAGWLVTADTLLGWHRRRIAGHWTQPQRPPGPAIDLSEASPTRAAPRSRESNLAIPPRPRRTRRARPPPRCVHGLGRSSTTPESTPPPHAPKSPGRSSCGPKPPSPATSPPSKPSRCAGSTCCCASTSPPEPCTSQGSQTTPPARLDHPSSAEPAAPIRPPTRRRPGARARPRQPVHRRLRRDLQNRTYEDPQDTCAHPRGERVRRTLDRHPATRNSSTAPSSGTAANSTSLSSTTSIMTTRTRPHRSLDQRPPVATDPPDQPDRHLQVVKTARCGGLINEYRNAA